MDEQTKLPECIAYGVELGSGIDSEAHVIPNALGGRLKPRGILSVSANSKIGECIEAPLFTNYQSVMSLVDGKRQRGDHPSFQVTGPDGKTYLYKPNHSLSPARPSYNREPTETGDVINIVARTMVELRTLLGRVTKEFPNFDVAAAISSAQVVSEPSPRVEFELSVGPNVYFPMAYVMAAQFNAYGRLPVHPSFPAYIRSLKKGSVGLPPDTFYWEPVCEVFGTVTRATHLITTVASVKKRQSLTVSRLIGLPGVATINDYHGERPRVLTYAVDVSLGCDVSVDVDAPAIAALAWSSTHVLGQDALYTVQKARMDAVLGLSKELGIIR